MREASMKASAGRRVNRGWPGTVLRRLYGAVLLGVVSSALACDLSVVNQGPIDDGFMDNKLAHAAMVAGAERELAVALGFHAVTIGGVTREVNAAGNVCSFGITALQTQGMLGSEDW